MVPPAGHALWSRDLSGPVLAHLCVSLDKTRENVTSPPNTIRSLAVDLMMPPSHFFTYLFLNTNILSTRG